MPRYLTYGGRILAIIVLCLAATLASAFGQEPNNNPPLREAQRPAPDRKPTITRKAGPQGKAEMVAELPAAADAYIASARPDENFGSSALYVGYHNVGDDQFGAQRSLLRFDLSSIPENAHILEARLRLYMSFATPADNEAMRIVARQLHAAWDEQFVTWNTEPVWGDVHAETFVGLKEGWYEWDLTALAAAWIADHTLNHGIELIGDEQVQQRERAFNARETETNLYPRLVVRYTEEADNQPPSATVDPLPIYTPRNFTVSWSSSDPGGSGIAYYDVQYSVNGGAWIDWQMGTTATNADFTGGESGHTYGFRARAVDNAGNTEPFGDAEAHTTVDVNVPVALVDPLPQRTEDASFTVAWSGTDIGSGVAYYDVRYRIDGGSWILWQQQTAATSAIFTAQRDGSYDFEARAVDQAGLREPFIGAIEASILVDTTVQFTVPRLWLPLSLKLAR